MKMKAKIVCHSGADYNVTAAKLLVMAGQLLADTTPGTPVESQEAAKAFVDGVIRAAVSGGYTKPELLRAALGSSQRSNRLAVMAHEACKAVDRNALANLIGGVPC